MLKLADVVRESGHVGRSAEIYRHALKLSPNNARAHYGLGRALPEPEAIPELRTALSIFPRYGAAQFALASALRKQGDEITARDLMRDYERDKTLLPPLEDPEMAAVRALNAGASALMQRAGEQELEGRLKEAAALYTRAMAADPTLVAAHVALIAVYGRMKSDSEAEKAYRRAIHLNPDETEAHYNYGVLCFERGRIPEARSAFLRVIQLQPRHAEALHNLGAIAEQAGNWEAAASLYRRALNVKATYPLARFHLGRIYANQRKYRLAIEQLERSLEPPSPETPVYLYALAATNARAGNRHRAAELLSAARSQAEARGLNSIVASIDRDLALLNRKP
jgi:tetratricopeptide (TPR) repeat protein